MLFSFVRQLRKKPKAARERFAVGAAGSLTATVFIVWLVFDGPGGVFNGSSAANEEDSSFSLFFDQMRDQTASFIDAVSVEQEPVDEIDLGAIEALLAGEAESTAIDATTTATTSAEAQTVLIATTSPTSTTSE